MSKLHCALCGQAATLEQVVTEMWREQDWQGNTGWYCPACQHDVNDEVPDEQLTVWEDKPNERIDQMPGIDREPGGIAVCLEVPEFTTQLDTREDPLLPWAERGDLSSHDSPTGQLRYGSEDDPDWR